MDKLSPFPIPIEKLDYRKRSRLTLTIADELKDWLKDTYAKLNIEKYSLSYFIEDLIYWVVSDEDRFNRFLKDMYVDYSNIPKIDDIGKVMPP